jgi:hypothetical protein
MPKLYFRDKTAAPAIAREAAHLSLLVTLVFSAHASPPTPDKLWMAVGDNTLDSLRGGFSMGDGLMVSFGISRAVFINDALITETTLNVGHMEDLTPAHAAQLSQKLTTLSLVQNGPGNTFASGPSTTTSSSSGATGPTVTDIAGNTTGTLIQNSLNNQQIRYQTIINASSNGLGLVRSSNLHNTLAEAIQQGIGQR